VDFADTYVLEELASIVFSVEGTDQFDAEVRPSNLPISLLHIYVIFISYLFTHITTGTG